MTELFIDKSAVPDYTAMLNLKNRVFVVLGGGNGIGRQVCHALSQAGGRIACVDRTPELAERVANEVGGVPIVGDITSRKDMVRIFSEAKEKLGPVTGLVDIVGMPLLGPFEDMDDDRWQEQFDLVLRHAYLAMHVGCKEILAAGGGTMVFIGSNSGNAYVRHQSAYGSAKAALQHLVQTVGREFASRGVRINGISPGFTTTPRIVNHKLTKEQLDAVAEIIPAGRTATPSEIAAPVLFLSSDLSSNVFGRMLLADGGLEGTMPLPASFYR